MNKFDIYKMIEEGKLKEASLATNTLYVKGLMSEETYDKLMDAIFEAKNSNK